MPSHVSPEPDAASGVNIGRFCTCTSSASRTAAKLSCSGAAAAAAASERRVTARIASFLFLLRGGARRVGLELKSWLEPK